MVERVWKSKKARLHAVEEENRHIFQRRRESKNARREDDNGTVTSIASESALNSVLMLACESITVAIINLV